MPFARQPYKVFRNVKDYGARGDGCQDDTEFIQRAIDDPTAGERCGANCRASSTQGAVIYFPPGKYLISRPIIQQYYTVFMGDPKNKPSIVGSADFEGTALIDADPRSGANNWYGTNRSPNGFANSLKVEEHE
jgi:glucan 1,3-beta-glucosidase